MSTKSNGTTDEEQNPWHALGIMIGESITTDKEHFHASGGYLVIRDEDGDIHVYREIAFGATEDELPDEPFDHLHEWEEYFTANEKIATIPAPEGGWEDEVEMLPPDIWCGFR